MSKSRVWHNIIYIAFFQIILKPPIYQEGVTWNWYRSLLIKGIFRRTGGFCHSEERSDEESRKFTCLSWIFRYAQDDFKSPTSTWLPFFKKREKDSSLRSEWRENPSRLCRIPLWKGGTKKKDSSAKASEWRVWCEKILSHYAPAPFSKGAQYIKHLKSQVKVKIKKTGSKTSKTHEKGYRFV